MATTPIIKISQLPQETEKTISGNPGNTWFAIVNADVMKTKRVSLESILKYISEYFDEPAVLTYLRIRSEGGIKANSSSNTLVNLGETITFSDVITFEHANQSFSQANASFLKANASFLKTNLSYQHANSGFVHANNAFNKANLEFTLSHTGGISLTSNNATNSVLKLGQHISISAQPLTISTTDGLKIDNLVNKAKYLGESISLSTDPITINTTNGITGGGIYKLGNTLTLDGSKIFNHSNSAYAYANNCMIKPSISYITSEQNNLITVANTRYIFVGDSSSLLVARLPTGTPKTNTFIYFTNATSSKECIISYNGTRIHGLPANENLRLDVPNVSISMCYVDSIRGWVIV